MKRRSFLQALLVAPAAVVAAKYGSTVAEAHLIKDQLEADLGKTTVGFSDVKPFSERFIQPVCEMQVDVWTDEVMRAYGDELNIHRSYIRAAAKELAGKIDKDIQEAIISGVDKDRMIIQQPRAEVIESYGHPRVRLTAGVSREKNIFGREHLQVGYINEPKQIYTGDKNEATDKQPSAIYTGR